MVYDPILVVIAGRQGWKAQVGSASPDCISSKQHSSTWRSTRPASCPTRPDLSPAPCTLCTPAIRPPTTVPRPPNATGRVFPALPAASRQHGNAKHGNQQLWHAKFKCWHIWACSLADSGCTATALGHGWASPCVWPVFTARNGQHARNSSNARQVLVL